MDISFRLEEVQSAGQGIYWKVWMSPEDAALLLGAEYAFYNAGPTSIIGEDGKPHLYYISSANRFIWRTGPILRSGGIRKMLL